MATMRTAVVTLAIALASAAYLEAQDRPHQQSRVFRSNTSLVALNVSVTDTDEQYASGLGRDDFEVYEDGVRQTVEFFAAAEVPLDLILLIDGSSSMIEKITFVRGAATGFITTMRPEDRAAVVSFADGVRVLQPLTGDRAMVARAIDRTGAKGATSLHTAIYIALKEFGRPASAAGEVRRQAIAVLSDGEDTSSGLSFDDVLDMAKRSGVSIYTIGLRDTQGGARQRGERRHFSQADFSMKQLAVETGAMPFFPSHAEELNAVYAAIATELASQYSIGYVPQNVSTDGTYRRVVVKVANRPELRSRTRTGYFLAAEALDSGRFEQHR